jgi:hypothetical protein
MRSMRMSLAPHGNYVVVSNAVVWSLYLASRVRQASPELGRVIWWPLIHILTNKSFCNAAFFDKNAETAQSSSQQLNGPTIHFKFTLLCGLCENQNTHFGTSVQLFIGKNTHFLWWKYFLERRLRRAPTTAFCQASAIGVRYVWGPLDSYCISCRPTRTAEWLHAQTKLAFKIQSRRKFSPDLRKGVNSFATTVCCSDLWIFEAKYCLKHHLTL